jgi:uncharacterized protein YbjQ (UPF0145 family)
MSGTSFVSTLPTGGFLTLGDAGFRPTKPVQGTSVVRLGYQRKPRGSIRGSLAPMTVSAPSGLGASQVYFPRGSSAVQQYLNEGASFELKERTAAYNEARAQALARLGAAAREAGACAVVDVRIRRGRFGVARRTIEFTALGTAVTSKRFEAVEGDPIPLVGLSGTDFWKLVESGVWPLGVVGGTSVVYVVSGLRTKFARFRLSRRSYRNQEYLDYTEGVRTARLHAASRLRREATELGASGVVGVSVLRTVNQQRDDDLLVSVELIGTAVGRLETGAPSTIAYALGLGKA